MEIKKPDIKAEIRSKLNMEKHTALQNVIPINSPYLIYLDPSSACNFKCIFCPTGSPDSENKLNYKKGILKFDLFKKVIDDLKDFEKPLKVLRLNKVGEPFLNKKLGEMIEYAKESGHVESLDLATNGSLLSKEIVKPVIDAGIDRINISVEGINVEQYRKFSNYDIDYNQFIENIKWLYENKGDCEITIKIPGDYLNESEKEKFYTIFGNYCDRIFIETIAPIWPTFDVEKASGIDTAKLKAQYEGASEYKEVCTYIFYSFVINADGTVSACCPDWNQNLIVGDIKEQTLFEIWNSKEFNDLRRQHLEGRRNENDICKNCGHIIYSQVDNIDPYREELFEKFIKYEESCDYGK